MSAPKAGILRRGERGILLKLHDDIVNPQAGTSGCVDLFHHTAAFGPQDVFHFHRLDSGKSLTLLHVIAFCP